MRLSHSPARTQLSLDDRNLVSHAGLDALRHGAMADLFRGVRAPSTVG
jgi:hypothetical protein